jgi:hypothetical protein
MRPPAATRPRKLLRSRSVRKSGHAEGQADAQRTAAAPTGALLRPAAAMPARRRWPPARTPYLIQGHNSVKTQ